MEPVEAESGECVVAAIAKVEIRRVSPLVNGVCSCSEGGRPPVIEAARVYGRGWGKGGFCCYR